MIEKLHKSEISEPHKPKGLCRKTQGLETLEADEICELVIQERNGEIEFNDWFCAKRFVSIESLKEYVRDLETSNEMYAKDAQELFDDLIEKIEEIKK